jgi:protocatechuate 3,4-dioxygenase beta subunit
LLILVFFVFLTKAERCWAQSNAPKTGTISGRVLAGNGEPLRRATVAIEEVNSADGSGEALGSVTTGDNGEFSFTDAAPARYRLLAERSGYVTGRFPRSKALVTLHAGDNIEGVTLRMVPTSVVSGSVLDVNGDPLAKAVVRLLQYHYSPGGRRLEVVREGASDERGEFRMGDLNPGHYYLVASYRSHISDVVCPPQYYSDASSFEKAVPIQLTPGNELPARFVLIPGKPVKLRGNVSGGGNQTIKVRLIPRGGVPFAESLSVETSNGTFQFKQVLPGSYTVLATSTGRDEIVEGRTEIEVENHDLDHIAVRLDSQPTPTKLYVAVNYERNYFGPFSKSTISLNRTFASGDDDLDAVASISTKDELGGHVLDFPAKGPYVLSASDLPPGDFYIEKASIEVSSMGRSLPPGTRVLNILLNSKGGSLDGLVLGADDLPMPGAVVVAVPRVNTGYTVDLFRKITTDQYGEFVLHGLAPVAYDVYAWEDVPDGAYYDPEYVADYAKFAKTISDGTGKHWLNLRAISPEDW